MDDPKFRLSQEIEAYQAQWRYIEANKNRQMKRAMFKSIVDSLTSSIYGKMVTKAEAERLLQGE